MNTNAIKTIISILLLISLIVVISEWLGIKHAEEIKSHGSGSYTIPLTVTTLDSINKIRNNPIVENTYNVDSAAAIQSIHQNYSKWYKQFEGKGFGMPTPDMDTVWLLLGYAWKLSDDSEHGYGTLTVTASKYDTLSKDSLRYYVEKLNNVIISPKHFFITSFHQFDTKHEFNLYKNLF